MSSWPSRVRGRAALLRFLVKYFEETSGDSRDPESHAALLEGFRIQLAKVEMEEAALLRRFAPLHRVARFVFGKARAI
jgi:hypothetical protein